MSPPHSDDEQAESGAELTGRTSDRSDRAQKPMRSRWSYRLGIGLIWVPIVVALLWGPISDWYQYQFTKAELGGFGLGRTIAACQSTPVGQPPDVLSALNDLKTHDFRMEMVFGEERRGWYLVHRHMVGAFRWEDWGGPEAVDLTRHGVDYTESVLRLRELWFSVSWMSPADEAFLKEWQVTCYRMANLP